jgi:hypothetical protein
MPVALFLSLLLGLGTGFTSLVPPGPLLDSPRLMIRTVPALEGASFQVLAPCDPGAPRQLIRWETCHDGPVPYHSLWELTTNRDGVATTTLPNAGLYYVLFEGARPAEEGLRVAFSRWEDEIFTNLRSVRLHEGAQLIAGLDVARPVAFEFDSPAGEVIASERVDVVEFRSSIGSVHHLQGAGPHWLPAERVLNRDAGLESVPIVYALQRLEIDGSNVVNRGQQRFTAEPGTLSWQIDTLLYSAEILGRDALFGFPVGTGIILEYPDGSEQEFPYQGQDGVELKNVARGTYRVTISGASGLSLPVIMIVSRDQSASPAVFTLLDMLVLGAGGVLVALGLLFMGRPHLLPGFLPVTKQGRGESRTG